jgi:hypothetical protein
MANYLREQSAGEILRGTISIYRRGFLPLCGMYLLPTFPFHLLKLKMLGNPEAYIYLWIALWVLVTPFAAAALTVGVSDICVGNRPSIGRSLRRVFGVILGKLIFTNLFVFLIVTAAFVPCYFAFLWQKTSASLFLCLFVVGIILTLLFLIWWMFVPTVVVLERTWAWTALQRSRILGKGFYTRNTALVLLLYLPTTILAWIIYATLQISSSDVLKALGIVLQGILVPLPLIATVLLYYDLRARSEGYDLAMLGQDLRR